MRWNLRCFALACGFAAPIAAAGFLQLDPQNPHYFLFRGKPLVLVTSGEHYGAVLNRTFDYRRYLDELRANHLNLTRTWVGAYREIAGNFRITNNTLAPKPEDFIAPWPRSGTPGAADGGNKFDLASWNPAFFARLKDFLRQADARGVIVEVNLFCPYYEDSMWRVAPFNAANNINGIGDLARTDALALKDAKLTEAQVALVRKVVSELRDFGNLYFEVCNEPYFGGVTMEWQRLIARTIHDSEKDGARHLISMNIANGSVRVSDPDPFVSIFNFHYSRPPLSVGMNYTLNRAIGCNETGFDGNSDSVYRIQGWDFLVAGGALYNNLDYSFTAGHEDGSFQYPAATPGGGGAALRKQLRFLRDFFATLDLPRMHPDTTLLAGAPQDGGSARALSDGSRRYVAYFHHASMQGKPARFTVDTASHTRSLELRLPAGRYVVRWLDPKSGATLGRSVVQVRDQQTRIQSPPYTEDVVLDVRR